MTQEQLVKTSVLHIEMQRLGQKSCLFIGINGQSFATMSAFLMLDSLLAAAQLADKLPFKRALVRLS